ncbi:MAG: adenylate kinase [Sandaracinus sp.]|nr:adenylate kinase [Sandaracinus sp.]|tara:strand:- start:1385 stop:2008 length:624 start_codon:yes stop_codon:yes gene_type:complete
MDLVLFGPPGAGKGTQAVRIREQLDVPQISTGDMMRAARREGTPLGKKFDEYMSAGKLVPDALVLELMKERLSKPDAAKGAIFDGFPRTVAQAEALDELLAEMGRKIDQVVVLEVPVEDIVDRVTGRRSDPTSGQVYHVRYNPPPAGLEVVQRKDDTEEVVRKRFQEYEANTMPVLPHYDAKGLVKRVDGVGSLDEVTERIRAALGA